MKQIITISHQYGSAGRLIGDLIAKQLGFPCYDSEIIERAAQRSGIHRDCFQNIEQDGNRFYSLLPGAPFALALKDEAYLAQHQAIQELAKQGPCVMIGHGACEVLKTLPEVFRVFIYADLETRKKRIIEEHHELKLDSSKALLASDKQRSTYYHFYYGAETIWTDHFDLCLDSSRIGIEKAVHTILTALE